MFLLPLSLVFYCYDPTRCVSTLATTDPCVHSSVSVAHEDVEMGRDMTIERWWKLSPPSRKMWGEMEPFRCKDYCPVVAAIARSELTANGRNVTAKTFEGASGNSTRILSIYFIQTKSTKE